MDNNLDAIQHLESDTRIIQEEQGSIQVVGRPLTEEEKQRITDLTKKIADISEVRSEVAVVPVSY